MLSKIMQNKDLWERSLVDLFEEGLIKIGDEIPYKHRGETYISPKRKNGLKVQVFSTSGLDVKWQAIGIERYGHEKCLKIISKEPTLKLELCGVVGYKYACFEMDNISSLFETGKGAKMGHNISIKDVNEMLGVQVDKKKRRIFQKGNDKENVNLYDNFLNTYNISNNDYIPEELLKDKNDSSREVEVTSYVYSRDSIIGRNKEKEIIFIDKEYGLTPTGVAAHDGYAFLGIGNASNGYIGCGNNYLFNSKEGNNTISISVRPIIRLKEDTTWGTFFGTSSDFEELFRQLEETRQKEEQIIKEIKKLM